MPFFICWCPDVNIILIFCVDTQTECKIMGLLHSEILIGTCRFVIHTVGELISFCYHKIVLNNIILMRSRMSQFPLVTPGWEEDLRSPWWDENRVQLLYRLGVVTILWESSKCSMEKHVIFGGPVHWRCIMDTQWIEESDWNPHMSWFNISQSQRGRS